MDGNELYIFSLRDTWFYTPGTYTISLYVKSKQLTLPINVKTDMHTSNHEKFNMEPINIPLQKVDPIKLDGTEISVEIDRGIVLRLLLFCNVTLQD